MRTLLRSTTSEDWTAQSGVVSLTVPDIAGHNYLTLTILIFSNTAERSVTVTYPTARIPVDATPDFRSPQVVFPESVIFTIGRNTAGTTLYVNALQPVTGCVAAVWGGPF